MIYPNIQLFAEGGEKNDGRNDGGNAGDGGNGSKTYTQEELDNIVNERTGRAAKSALKSFFEQKGLSEDEVNSAVKEYLENRKKNSPDADQLKQQLQKAQDDLAEQKLIRAAEKAARKLGADDNSIDYVVTLADLKSAVEDGRISDEKLTAAVKKVLDDVPAFKKSASGKSGVSKVGGDGGGKGSDDDSDSDLRKAFGLKPKK